MKPLLIALLLVTFTVAGCDFQGPVAEETEPSATVDTGPATAMIGATPMVLNLLGADVAETGVVVPDPNGWIPDDLADCFTVPLIDVSQHRVVGEGTDCISVVGGNPVDGLQVVGTTIFDFGNGHSFTTQGLTSVQPTTHGSPGITHITGAIPVAGSNDVIAGTGRFANFAATSRLSGAVDLSALGSEGKITFDCLFVVTRL